MSADRLFKTIKNDLEVILIEGDVYKSGVASRPAFVIAVGEGKDVKETCIVGEEALAFLETTAKEFRGVMDRFQKKRAANESIGDKKKT